MFRNKRFGMFVHWGIYSVGAWHEQEQQRYPVASEEYVKYAEQFNPKEYNPREWVALAKKTGMDYICFTTKHHDGFCMWDTKYTDFKITNTPYGKDVLKELAEACSEAGMGLSLYYSVPDWHHPNYPNFGRSHELDEPKIGDEPDEEKYIQYVKNQVTELLTNYGKILSFFWDIPPEKKDPTVNELVRKLQPGIFINNRGYDEGDFATPEREIPKGGRFTSYTEACDSVGRQSWGFRMGEDYYSHLHTISSIDQIMAMGGNFVLNAGPDSLGRISEETKESFEAVGKWYHNVKEALFAEPASDLIPAPNTPDWVPRDQYFMTKSGNALYFHFPKGPDSTGIFVENIVQLPKRAIVLNDGTPLTVTMDKMPTLCNGTKSNFPPVFHINGIPVNRITTESIVLKLEFDDLKTAIDMEKKQGTEGRL